MYSAVQIDELYDVTSKLEIKKLVFLEPIKVVGSIPITKSGRISIWPTVERLISFSPFTYSREIFPSRIYVTKYHSLTLQSFVPVLSSS